MPDKLEKPSKDLRLPTVDLTPELHERLLLFLASHTKPPTRSEVVRAALDKFLPKIKKLPQK